MEKKRVIKDVIMIGVGILMLVAFIIIGSNEESKEEGKGNETTLTDAAKFAKEYTEVPEDNVFVYRTGEEIISILKGGTGVVYLGFEECKWCQAYAVMLDEVAKEVGVEKIYYFDIREDRENNTEVYQEIIEIIGDRLQKDEEGKPRVYVPDVSFVKEGKMIGHDYETSLDTKGFEEPEDYWTEKEVKDLKTKLKKYMEEIVTETCETC